MLDDISLPFTLGDVQKVSVVWLTLTNQCNIHCKYCFNYVEKDHEKMSGDLSARVLRAHLKQLGKSNIENIRVVFFGGEPTLNADGLISALETLRNSDAAYDAVLLTNGLFAESLLDKLAFYNLTYQVSYDGEQGSLRLSKNGLIDVHEKIDKKIKILVKAGVRVDVRATVHSENVDHLTSLVEHLHSLGVSTVNMAPICTFGDAKKNGVRPPEVARYIENAKNAHVRCINLGMTLCYHSGISGRPTSKFSVPFVWLPDGKAAMTITYPSSKLPNADSIIIGQFVKESNTIEVDKAKVASMKKNYLKNRRVVCANCIISSTCQGRIHVTPFLTDTFVPERDSYFCDMARAAVRAN
jgi:sulfatase maturation enzyme AslB (radical SAM superfamily)